MAIAGFKYKTFDDPQSLAAFVVASVTTVYAIVYDNSGKYNLFYA